MNAKIAVLTAIVGDIDYLHDPKYVTEGVDYICYTDQDYKSDIWDVRNDYIDIIRQYDERDVMIGKIFKIQPHLVIPEYDYVLWVDGTYKINTDIRKFIEGREEDIHLYRHPIRDCIYDEAKLLLASRFSKENKYFDRKKMIQQMDRYREEGLPKNSGQFSGSFILRRQTKYVEKFNKLWWDETYNNSRRDQLSQAYIIWKHKIKYGIIDGVDRRDNRFIYIGHGKHE